MDDALLVEALQNLNNISGVELDCLLLQAGGLLVESEQIAARAVLSYKNQVGVRLERKSQADEIIRLSAFRQHLQNAPFCAVAGLQFLFVEHFESKQLGGVRLKADEQDWPMLAAPQDGLEPEVVQTHF